jgi:AbrB family looped-hinge helix DNA binding protein
MTTLQIRSKGTITLPAELRRKYNWEEGEILTAIDLGNGTIVLKSQPSEIDKISSRLAKSLKEENVTLDDLLTALDEERKTIYQELYVKKE